MNRVEFERSIIETAVMFTAVRPRAGSRPAERHEFHVTDYLGPELDMTDARAKTLRVACAVAAKLDPGLVYAVTATGHFTLVSAEPGTPGSTEPIGSISRRTPMSKPKFTSLSNAQLSFVLSALSGKNIERFNSAASGRRRVEVALGKLDVPLTTDDLMDILAEYANGANVNQTKNGFLRLVDIRQADKREEAKPMAKRAASVVGRGGMDGMTLTPPAKAEPKKPLLSATPGAVAKAEELAAENRAKAEVVDFATARAEGDRREALQRAAAAVKSGDKAVIREAAEALKRAKLDPSAVLAEQHKKAAEQRAALKTTPPPTNGKPEGKSKKRWIIDMISREGGATLGELLDVLGWKSLTSFGRLLTEAGISHDRLVKEGSGREQRVSIKPADTKKAV